jgi:hypothetical protein
VASSASTTVLSDAALRSARWRSEDLTPAASTTSEHSAMLAHLSTELVARAPCQLRRAHARSVRAARRVSASSAALRSTNKTRKRDVQTGGAAGAFERRPREAPSRGDEAGTFFSRGRLPVVYLSIQ